MMPGALPARILWPVTVRIAVLIPVYNEARWAKVSIGRVLAVHAGRAEVIVVDDGSTDGTAATLAPLHERGEIILLAHPSNLGKGAAIRTAMMHALSREVDVLLIHDADLEYDPADHAAVLAPILDGRADAVIGSRFIGQTHRVLYYWHRVANGIITTACNMATNLNLTDVECCTKAFTSDVARGLSLREERFGVEIELIARIARARLPQNQDPSLGLRPTRVYEVAVSYAGRTYDEGKKITWRDGLRALWCVLRYGVFRG
jgi:glycosyltransferase involved in cell wall biosynthesis